MSNGFLILCHRGSDAATVYVNSDTLSASPNKKLLIVCSRASSPKMDLNNGFLDDDPHYHASMDTTE